MLKSKNFCPLSIFSLLTLLKLQIHLDIFLLYYFVFPPDNFFSRLLWSCYFLNSFLSIGWKLCIYLPLFSGYLKNVLLCVHIKG